MRYPNEDTGQQRSRDLLSRREVLAAAAGLAAAQLIAGTTAAAQSPETNRRGKDKMKTRKLGSLEVSELGFGNMGLSGGHYGPGVDRALTVTGPSSGS